MNIGIRPSANSVKAKRVVRQEPSVCFRITNLMNNQIKSRKRATSQKEEKAMTRMLWLLCKVYHNWVVNIAVVEKQMEQFIGIDTSETEIDFHEARRRHLH